MSSSNLLHKKSKINLSRSLTTCSVLIIFGKILKIDFDFYEKNYKNLVKTQNDDLKKQKNINLFALFRNKK
jgi:hypothetical protein